MKTTLKFSTLLVALASVFTFSSCLNSDDDSSYPTYSSYVTIAGGQFMDYTFYSDFGCILKPTTESVKNVLYNWNMQNVKRGIIYFDLASETEQIIEFKPGQRYDIVLNANGYNTPIPTYESTRHTAASDSLVTNNKSVLNVDKSIWAVNGFLNALITINYKSGKEFSMSTYYSEDDIDVTNNTLNLNLYYNSNSENSDTQIGPYPFSFRLPEEVIYNNHFSADSITLVLNAISGYDNSQLNKVGECKVALKDFSEPMF